LQGPTGEDSGASQADVRGAGGPLELLDGGPKAWGEVPVDPDTSLGRAMAQARSLSRPGFGPR